MRPYNGVARNDGFVPAYRRHSTRSQDQMTGRESVRTRLLNFRKLSHLRTYCVSIGKQPFLHFQQIFDTLALHQMRHFAATLSFSAGRFLIRRTLENRGQ